MKILIKNISEIKPNNYNPNMMKAIALNIKKNILDIYYKTERKT